MPAGGASHERIERLVRITPELVGELRLDRVLQRVADLARDLLEARYSAIGLLNPDNETLASFTTSGLSDAGRSRIGTLPVGYGVLGLVIQEGKILRLPDIQKHPSSVGFPAHHPPMKSFLGVPIIGRQGVLGDLYLTDKIGAAEFSDEDVHVAQLLASIIASAVENARLYERTARLLEEVQQLHRSRERFFAMVNHELRNALAAVYGWSEMLVRRKDPETVPRGAFEILEAAEQAVALVNDLLDLSRLDEDRLKPVLKLVDCCQLIQTAIIRVKPAADEKRVAFDAPSRSLHLLCHTDAHRVEQILVNVLTNAIRHTPAGSTITLSARAADDRVEITVLDQGEGVAEEDVDRIFDIYYTTATAAETGRVGYGVGLPLSRRLARVLGGDLVAVAQLGHGGRFVLRLPAAKP
jgi:signal transduction histidine kinase